MEDETQLPQEEEQLLQGIGELGHTIAALAGTDSSARQVGEELGFKPGELGKHLRDYRRRFALLMFGRLAPEIHDFTVRYYKLLDKALTELEGRDLEDMNTKDLLRYHDSIVRWIQAVNQGIVLAPRDTGVDPFESRQAVIPGRPETGMAQAMALIQAAQQQQASLSNRSPRETEKMRDNLSRVALPPARIPNETIRPIDRDERGSIDGEIVPESPQPSPDVVFEVLSAPPVVLHRDPRPIEPEMPDPPSRGRVRPRGGPDPEPDE
jgi:hypothetical protein